MWNRESGFLDSAGMDAGRTRARGAARRHSSGSRPARRPQVREVREQQLLAVHELRELPVELQPVEHCGTEEPAVSNRSDRLDRALGGADYSPTKVSSRLIS
jgi:hypothetical protein